MWEDFFRRSCWLLTFTSFSRRFRVPLVECCTTKRALQSCHPHAGCSAPHKVHMLHIDTEISTACDKKCRNFAMLLQCWLFDAPFRQVQVRQWSKHGLNIAQGDFGHSVKCMANEGKAALASFEASKWWWCPNCPHSNVNEYNRYSSIASKVTEQLIQLELIRSSSFGLFALETVVAKQL